MLGLPVSRMRQLMQSNTIMLKCTVMLVGTLIKLAGRISRVVSVSSRCLFVGATDNRGAFEPDILVCGAICWSVDFSDVHCTVWMLVTRSCHFTNPHFLARCVLGAQTQ